MRARVVYHFVGPNMTSLIISTKCAECESWLMHTFTAEPTAQQSQNAAFVYTFDGWFRVRILKFGLRPKILLLQLGENREVEPREESAVASFLYEVLSRSAFAFFIGNQCHTHTQRNESKWAVRMSQCTEYVCDVCDFCISI
jgi:hypothetical protein